MFTLKQIIEQPQLIENISNEQLNDWIKSYPYISFLHLEKYKRNRTEEQKSKTAFYITHRDVLYKIDFNKETQKSELIQNSTNEIFTSSEISEESSISIPNEEERIETTIKTSEIETETIPEKTETLEPQQEPEKLSIADQILAELQHRKEEENAETNIVEETETVETELLATLVETPKTEIQITTEEIEIAEPNQEPEKLSIADQILAQLKHRKEEENSETHIIEETENKETEQSATIEETPEIEIQPIIEESEVLETPQEPEKLSIADEILAQLKHRKEEENAETHTIENPAIVETEQFATIEETSETEIQTTTEEIEIVEQNQEPEKLSIADEILAQLKHRKEVENTETHTIEETENKETEPLATIVETPEIEIQTTTEETEIVEPKQPSIVDQILLELKNRKETVNIQTPEIEEQEIKEEELVSPELTTTELNDEIESLDITKIETSVEEKNKAIEQPKSTPKTFSIADQILSAIQQITSKVITIPMEKAIAQIKETDAPLHTETTSPQSNVINTDTEIITTLPNVKVANDFIFDEVQLEIPITTQENDSSIQENIENTEVTEEDTYFPSIPLEDEPSNMQTKDDVKLEPIKIINENNLQEIKIDAFIPESNKTVDKQPGSDIVLKEIGDYRQNSEHFKFNIDKINPIEENRSKIIEISQSNETHTFLEWLNIVDKSYEQNTQKLETARQHFNYENQFILDNKTELQQSILEGELDSETEIDEDVNKMAEDSISFKQEMATEILAKILVKQEHFEKAIEVYQKLILKYPEKSSTFVAQIEFLKKQIQ